MKKKATISIFTTVFFALTLTLFSYATTKTQDDLQVELTTDKSSYTSSDTIIVSIKVTNTGTTAVSDLTLENTIPMGYTKTTNTSSTKSVSILLAGDEAMLTTSFVKDGSDTSSGGSSAGNTSGGSGGTSGGSSNASSGTSGTGGNSNSSSSGSSGTGGNSNSSSSGSNDSSTRSGKSSSNASGTTNTTDGVKVTNASDSSQSGDAGTGDTTIREGTTSATSGDDTTGDEISGTGGDSPTSDVGDDSSDGTSSNEGDNGESDAIVHNENAYEDETVAGIEGSDIDGDSTGDGGVSTVAIAVGVIVVVGIAVAIVKIKSGKKLLSILICMSMMSVFEGRMLLTVKAAEYKTIEVSEDIKIGSETVKVVGSVKYQVVGGEEALGETLPMPERLSSSEQYYWETYDVYKIVDATSSVEMYAENEAIELIKERGFIDNYNLFYDSMPIYYNWSTNGTWHDDKQPTSDSIEKHPEYIVEYISKSGELWALYIVDGQIWANPLSYNLTAENAKYAIYVSETNTVVEYVSASNSFYTVIPKPEYIKIVQVDKIDAITLDSLNMEELWKK